MDFQKREATIQRILEELNLETKESGKDFVLTEWRKSLALEPYLLRTVEIDQIMREVRKRIASVP